MRVTEIHICEITYWPLLTRNKIVKKKEKKTKYIKINFDEPCDRNDELFVKISADLAQLIAVIFSD